jgi:TatD DNase family protein
MDLFDFHTHCEKDNSIHSVDPRYSVNTKQKYIYGPHPWYLNELDLNRVESVIRANHQKNEFFGIGEIGIDRCIEICPLEQTTVFERFLKLAIELETKNIVIHCVRAYSDILAVLKRNKYNGNIIFHDFNANNETLKQLEKFNCYFSIGARLYSKNAKILETIKVIPLERLLFETDDQQKFQIEDIYQKACEVLDINAATLNSQMQSNLSKLLK